MSVQSPVGAGTISSVSDLVDMHFREPGHRSRARSSECVGESCASNLLTRPPMVEGPATRKRRHRRGRHERPAHPPCHPTRPDRDRRLGGPPAHRPDPLPHRAPLADARHPRLLGPPRARRLDAAILGVIAGRLQRLPAGTTIETGANTERQVVMRPRVALDPYRTGIRGTFICSAASPPGAGAHGMCGCNAAGSALRHLRITPVNPS